MGVACLQCQDWPGLCLHLREGCERVWSQGTWLLYESESSHTLSMEPLRCGKRHDGRGSHQYPCLRGLAVDTAWSSTTAAVMPPQLMHIRCDGVTTVTTGE